MLQTTLPRLRCPNAPEEQPACAGPLSLPEIGKKKGSEITSGTLRCAVCEATYPILAGVAILVSDVEDYFRAHVKGIASLVPDEDIPDLYLDAYLQAKAEIETGLTDQDLESERVNALYFMNHYLRVKSTKDAPWWRPAIGFSPEIDRLVKAFWDNGPFAKIAAWTKSYRNQDVIELACGSGGLAQALGKVARSYLGVDYGFAGIALARHMNLGTKYALPIRLPQDLYNGALTKKITPPKAKPANIDFVVGEIQNLPVAAGEFDLAIALNVIDMMADPSSLPRIQRGLLKAGGVAVQSSPYIWHEGVVEQLRQALPRKIKSSSQAVEFLYERSGFSIFKKLDHVPWLFLKHFRQIEMYSVHLFAGRKTS